MSPTQTDLGSEIAVVTSPAARNIPAASYHQDLAAPRLLVAVADGFVGASIRSTSLRYCSNPESFNEELSEIYARHVVDLDTAVWLRVAQGSIERVMLRESDLKADSRL